MLILDVNYRKLNEIAHKASPGHSGYLFILDEQGNYVYHPDSTRIGEPVYPDYWNKMQGHENGSFIADVKPAQADGETGVLTSGSQLVTFSQSSHLKWTVATTLPYAEVTEGIGYIQRTTFYVVIIALVIAYLIGVSFASSIIRPIKRLHRYMKKVETGDFSHKIEVEARDEIGLLTIGFTKMVRRLSELLEEVYASRLKESELKLQTKDMELKVLQSQMNPHFLYNSLETIRGMALEIGETQIASLSTSLAKFLRYNLRETSNVVELQQEIEISTLYLRIQKFRYDDKLDYEFHIPPWALKQPCVKFSLQPMIENCIVHGLEPHAGHTMIRIYAEQVSEDAFTVWVSDTGAGIEDETIKKLSRDMERQDIAAGGSHIGIVNVHRRITYLFGESYGLTVQKMSGGGTLVGIRLPYQH